MPEYPTAMRGSSPNWLVPIPNSVISETSTCEASTCPGPGTSERTQARTQSSGCTPRSASSTHWFENEWLVSSRAPPWGCVSSTASVLFESQIPETG